VTSKRSHRHDSTVVYAAMARDFLPLCPSARIRSGREPTTFELVVIPQDRQGSRPDDPAVAAGAGGPSDRVTHERGAHPRSMKMAWEATAWTAVHIVLETLGRLPDASTPL
jgi:hypothetical protein